MRHVAHHVILTIAHLINLEYLLFIFSRDKDYPYYHIPDDDYDKLPLDGYEGIFKLIYDYIMQLNK